jgi:hypothetical protein
MAWSRGAPLVENVGLVEVVVVVGQTKLGSVASLG